MNEIRITIRFPPEVIDALRRMAARDDRSLNGEIVWALRQLIRQQEAGSHGDQSSQDPPESDT